MSVKLKLLIFSMFFPIIFSAQETDLPKQKKDHILTMINLFKNKDLESIANKIQYPLIRMYPIPDIKNKSELRQRFQEVFPDVFIKKIAGSTLEDWSEMGWRGIMLEDGKVWLDSEDGKIIAVNFQSDFAKNLEKKLIAEQKENIHP